MFNAKILKQSLLFSVLAIFYIVCVTTLMRYASQLFGPDDNKSFIGPIVFLLMLVVSAATMGMLIFGKPVMLYLDGKKREAVTMIACTVGSLVFFTVFLIAIAVFLR